MTSRSAVRVAAVLVGCLLLGTAALAQGLNNQELQFTGTVARIVEDGGGTGALFIALEDFELRVAVTDDTEIEDGSGDELALSQLKPDDQLTITESTRTTELLPCKSGCRNSRTMAASGCAARSRRFNPPMETRPLQSWHLGRRQRGDQDHCRRCFR